MTSDQIFKQLGIESADDDIKTQMLTQVMTIADLRFARVVDEIMTDEERQEFEAFAEGKQPQEIAQWVNEKYEGIGSMYDTIIGDIVADLKNKSVQGM